MSYIKQLFSQADALGFGSMEPPKSANAYKIYPILKPANWQGLQYGALCRTMGSPEEEPQLVIGYAYNGPENLIFLTQDQVQFNSKKDIFREAYENLKTYPATLHEVVPNKILAMEGEDFCSEKILLTSFLRELHHKLGSEKLLISIPRRKSLMVTSAMEDPELLELFMAAHKSIWEDAENENAPIMNMIFVIENGQFTDVLPPDPMALYPDSNPNIHRNVS